VCFSDLLQDRDIVKVNNRNTVCINTCEKEKNLDGFLVLFALTAKSLAEEDRRLLEEKANTIICCDQNYIKLSAVRDHWLWYMKSLYIAHFKHPDDREKHKVAIMHDLPSLYSNALLQHCYNVLAEAVSQCLFRGVERIKMLEKEYIVPCFESKFLLVYFRLVL
jgi:hypothetical protein